jgi:glycosyltransferase involved in cell wall biosynthesis
VSARQELGIREDAYLALYAGNLDAYQGVEWLLEALGRLPATYELLVATASDATPLHQGLAERGLRERVHVMSLADEAERARVHAAADVALVPRRAPGGLPIKLLDALARGLPVVANERALAGLEFGSEVQVVPDDDAPAFAHALLALHAQRRGPATPQATQATGGALRPFAPAAFVRGFEALCDEQVPG